MAKYKARLEEDKARAENEEFEDMTKYLQPEMQELVKLGDFQGKSGKIIICREPDNFLILNRVSIVIQF